MDELGRWLCTLTGMPAVALSPKAGAHGEMAGMLADESSAPGARRKPPQARAGAIFRARHQSGDGRRCRFYRRRNPAPDDGRVHLDDVKAKLSPDVAAIIIANPNTCGLFEPEIRNIADAIHAAGACSAMAPTTTPSVGGVPCRGNIGIDVECASIARRFSNPHGGGGPGAGPTVYVSLGCSRRSHQCAAHRAQSRCARTPRTHGRAREPLAACAPSTARWTCSRVRSPT